MCDTTAIDVICQWCGKPIQGTTVFGFQSAPFHPECFPLPSQRGKHSGTLYLATGQPEQPTLRDMFAMAALTACAAKLEHGVFLEEDAAEQAWRLADAMLLAREKGRAE